MQRSRHSFWFFVAVPWLGLLSAATLFGCADSGASTSNDRTTTSTSTTSDQSAETTSAGTSGLSDSAPETIASTAPSSSAPNTTEQGWIGSGESAATTGPSSAEPTSATSGSASSSAASPDGQTDGTLGTATGSSVSEGSSAPGETSSDDGSSESALGNWPVINGVQWADVAGKPIQAHGGGVLVAGGEYYWFGENRNSDSTFYAVSAYRSRDLMHWEHVHDVLTMNSDPELSRANVERPKVVYNAETQKYVMWMHWENGKDYSEARAAVASSDTIDGDYTYHGSFRPLRDSGIIDHDKPGYMSRDCTLFVDDDGAAYFLSAANENYDLRLYRLTPDYLEVESNAALLFEGGHREAPALFKRGDTYFLITSGATGWDPNQAQYATSKSLISGWSSLQNVGDGSTFYSQSTFVLPVTGSEGTQYLYLGDRWAGAWDGRVNDSTYVWIPLTFPSDSSLGMDWVNTLTLDATRGVVAGSVDAFTFTNKKSGLVLAVDGEASENGADLVVAPSASAQNATFRLNYNGAGAFRITNEAGETIIDVPDESTEVGTPLHLWEDNGGDHQVWIIVDLGNGDFRVRNKKSGLYVGVIGAAVGGAGIEQQAEGGDEQIWHIQAVPQNN
jgi:hypothetical protein